MPQPQARTRTGPGPPPRMWMGGRGDPPSRNAALKALGLEGLALLTLALLIPGGGSSVSVGDFFLRAQTCGSSVMQLLGSQDPAPKDGGDWAVWV